MLKQPMDWVAMVLVIVGGLNWGLVGLFDYNLVEAILGAFPTVERIVYVLVGLGAAYMIWFSAKIEPIEGRGTARPRGGE